MAINKMTAYAPHLLNAMRNWFEENNLTPHIVVFADVEGVSLPRAAAIKDKVAALVEIPMPDVEGLTLPEGTERPIVEVVQVVERPNMVLNISSRSTTRLIIDEHGIAFGARFGGKHFDVFVPIEAVISIYPHEEQGLIQFITSDMRAGQTIEQATVNPFTPVAPKRDRSHLSVVGK